jgi:GT2 family glycosyltransferase
MKITIVCAYNNEIEMTKKFLTNLQEYAPILWNNYVILVNGGSSVRIEHQFVDKRIDLETNEGFCKTLNAGLKEVPADTDYVLFTGNDSFPNYELWLPDLVNLQRLTKAWMVCPANDRPGMEVLRRKCKVDRGDYWEVDMFPSIVWLMPYDKFQQIGLLDERFIRTGMYADDDYCRRIRDAGGLIVVSTRIMVPHLLSVEGRALGTQPEDMGINRVKFQEKYEVRT